MCSTPSNSEAMDWSGGKEVYFFIGKKFGYEPLYRAVVGKDPEPKAIEIGSRCYYEDSTEYVYIPSMRTAKAVHGIERVLYNNEDNGWRIREKHRDIEEVFLVDGNTARKIVHRRRKNADCDRKGCLDRYDCIWFNADSEKESGPWNKVPKSYKPGTENCPRYISRSNDIKVKEYPMLSRKVRKRLRRLEKEKKEQRIQRKKVSIFPIVLYEVR